MKIWKLLLLQYLFSVLLSVILSFTFFLIMVKGDLDRHLIPITLIGAFFLNLPLTLLWSPGLFMSINFKNEKNKAFIVCFITPIAILGYVLFGAKLQYGDKEFYATQIISQILILCFMFFRRLTPDNIVEEE